MTCTDKYQHLDLFSIMKTHLVWQKGYSLIVSDNTCLNFPRLSENLLLKFNTSCSTSQIVLSFGTPTHTHSGYTYTRTKSPTWQYHHPVLTHFAFLAVNSNGIKKARENSLNMFLQVKHSESCKQVDDLAKSVGHIYFLYSELNNYSLCWIIFSG